MFQTQHKDQEIAILKNRKRKDIYLSKVSVTAISVIQNPLEYLILHFKIKKKYTQETVPKRSFSNICHSSEVALLKAFRLYNLQHIFLHIYLLMQIYI